MVLRLRLSLLPLHVAEPKSGVQLSSRESGTESVYWKSIVNAELVYFAI